jgi:hypothetical protein
VKREKWLKEIRLELDLGWLFMAYSKEMLVLPWKKLNFKKQLVFSFVCLFLTFFLDVVST